MQRFVRSRRSRDSRCWHSAPAPRAGREGREGREGLRRPEMLDVPFDRRQGQREGRARRGGLEAQGGGNPEWIVNPVEMAAKTKADRKPAMPAKFARCRKTTRRARRVPVVAEEEVAPRTPVSNARCIADREGTMRPRGVFAILVLTWALALTLSARAPQAAPAAHSAAAPSATPAPTADDCLACHDDATLKRGNGTPLAVSKAPFAASVHGPLGLRGLPRGSREANCRIPRSWRGSIARRCHDDAAKLTSRARTRPRAPAAATSPRPARLPRHARHQGRRIRSRAPITSRRRDVRRCHGNADVIAKGHIAAGDVTKPFADSIHGRALSRSGLVVAPTCSDCHGPHDIRKKTDPEGRVAMANVPATCGKCHEGIAHQFGGGVHAAVLAARERRRARRARPAIRRTRSSTPTSPNGSSPSSTSAAPATPTS